MAFGVPMEDGGVYDDEDDSGMFGTEAKVEFANEIDAVLNGIERQLVAFAMNNAALFAESILEDGSFSHKAYDMFEVYCTMVEAILSDYLKDRNLTKTEFLNTVRENLEEGDKYSTAILDALLGVEDFEHFCEFMTSSHEKDMKAEEIAADMGF